MRIDEECINYNALRLIERISYAIQEIDLEDEEKWAARYLYEIQGICELAEELKGVLKV